MEFSLMEVSLMEFSLIEFSHKVFSRLDDWLLNCKFWQRSWSGLLMGATLALRGRGFMFSILKWSSFSLSPFSGWYSFEW